MEYRVLGPLEVVSDGRPLALGGPKQRAVLAILVLQANEVVSVDRIIAGVWGESASDGALATLQVYVSGLRKILEPVKGEHRVIVAQRPGYMLVAEPDSIDAVRFERLVETARKELADERYEDASRHYTEALQLWRGEPLADFAFHDFAAPEASRLDGERVAALEDRIQADLARGRHT